MVAENNEFDRKLELYRNRLPQGMLDASIYVHDTLELAKAAARSYFGEEPSWECVLAVYDRIASKHVKILNDGK